MSKVLIFLCVLLVVALNVEESASQCYKLCRIGRTHGMKSEECYNVSVRTIPDCISRDVEVILY